jgi:uracil-DNA glycosylase
MPTPFDALLDRIHRCRECAEHLPLELRPILQADPRTNILIAGQAPGRRAHDSGLPFDDASGDRLRR